MNHEKNKPIGADLDDFLRDEGVLDEVEAEAAKEVLTMLIHGDDETPTVKQNSTGLENAKEPGGF